MNTMSTPSRWSTGSTVLALAAVMVALAPLHAQWLKYPTPGVPKKSDGSPNLSAPAPRTADGRPDLSGVWDIDHNRPCPPEGCADMEVGQEFVDFGWGLKGGLPLQPWAADLKQKRMEEYGKDDPASHCLPGGLAKNHTTPLLRKIVQTPGLLVILYERNATFRQIFLDGRPLPEINLPSANGYSSGKWEGDTLVVQSAGFTDGLWLDRNGSPMTDAAAVTERFRRVNFGRLEIEVTVSDSKAYKNPWTVTLTHLLVPDTDLVDYICLENERDIPHLVGK
jgi:hypothetical protein